MSPNPVRELFTEFYRASDLLHYVAGILPLQIMCIRGEDVSGRVNLEEWIHSVREDSQGLKFDQKRFERLLKANLSSVVQGKNPTQSLKKFLEEYRESIRNQIASVPSSIEKAYDSLWALTQANRYGESDQIYDAMVLLKDEMTATQIADVVDNWKRHQADWIERNKDSHFIVGEQFWSSRLGQEVMDSVSRYRFRESFNIGEFESVFTEVESGLASFLLEGCASMDAFNSNPSGSPIQTKFVFDLWLISRSRILTNRLSNYISLAVQHLAWSQSAAGYWQDLNDYSRSPDVYLTALASLCLLKLSVSESSMQKGTLGAKWLIKQQNTDGSWSFEHVSKDAVTAKPDVLVTLLALECISRGEIKGIEHTIKLGKEWLLAQQDEMGMWGKSGFPYPFTTVLALEFFKSAGSFPKVQGAYLPMAKHFLGKSLQFALEDNVNSQRLAVLTGFHGMEAFLYEVLSHPSVNIKIFEKPDETIGMKKALTKFQEHLTIKKIIKQGDVIDYRNSLDRLAYLRDEVVHKGIDITSATAQPLLDDAVKFTSKYSMMVFGFDLWV